MGLRAADTLERGVAGGPRVPRVVGVVVLGAYVPLVANGQNGYGLRRSKVTGDSGRVDLELLGNRSKDFQRPSRAIRVVDADLKLGGVDTEEAMDNQLAHGEHREVEVVVYVIDQVTDVSSGVAFEGVVLHEWLLALDDGDEADAHGRWRRRGGWEWRRGWRRGTGWWRGRWGRWGRCSHVFE